MPIIHGYRLLESDSKLPAGRNEYRAYLPSYRKGVRKGSDFFIGVVLREEDVNPQTAMTSMQLRR